MKKLIIVCFFLPLLLLSIESCIVIPSEKDMDEQLPEQVATPKASLSGGNYEKEISVELSCDTPGALIYYSTNSDYPEYQGEIYTEPIRIYEKTRLVAFAMKEEMEDSPKLKEDYSFKAANPVFSIAGGYYDAPQMVTISCSTENSVIYYTLDGTRPSSEKRTYKKPIAISVDTKLRAIARSPINDGSDIVDVVYDIGTKRLVHEVPMTTGVYWLTTNGSISSDGTSVIIGLNSDDINGYRSGSAFLFTYNGADWIKTMFTPSDPAEMDYYGTSCSISADGTLMLIGTHNKETVYVYRKNGSLWNETKLVPSDPSLAGDFGNTSCLSGDGSTVIAGSACCDYSSRTNSGLVLRYVWNGSFWDETIFSPSDAAGYDYFGENVSCSYDGKVFIAGAYCKSSGGVTCGAAYIYNWNGSGWDESKLVPPDGNSNDHYGQGVAVSSNGLTVMVGAPNSDANGENSGAVYAYRYESGSWKYIEKLCPENGGGDDIFGYGVALSSDGTKALIGAPNDDENSGYGSAYYYKFDGTKWINTLKIVPREADTFGLGLAFTGDAKKALISDHDGGFLFNLE